MIILTEAAGKNLHLEHLEDEILNFGIAGGRSSIQFLQALRDMFAGSSSKKLNGMVHQLYSQDRIQKRVNSL